jgi:hypothetical protein
MGMESFFIIILPKGVYHYKSEDNTNYYKGKSGISIDETKKLLNDLGNLKYIDVQELVCNISNKFLLIPNFENDNLVSIDIQSCLWYLKYAKDEIIRLLSYFINNKFNVFHPGIGALTYSVDDFMEKLDNFYKTNEDIFISKYGKLFRNKDFLPDHYFYDNISLASKIIKIFRFWKSVV